MAHGVARRRDHELAATEAGKNAFPTDAEALENDGGRYIGFFWLVAKRRGGEAFNLYDAVIMAKVWVE